MQLITYNTFLWRRIIRLVRGIPYKKKFVVNVLAVGEIDFSLSIT